MYKIRSSLAVIWSIMLLFTLVKTTCAGDVEPVSAKQQHYETYELIGRYDIERMQQILTADISTFTSKFADLIAYAKPLYPVNLYRVTYHSVIPEKNNQPTIASGLLAIPETDQKTIPVLSYQHGTAFGKFAVPSYPDDPDFMETRVMVARFASHGYMVVAADNFGKGVSQETEAYMVKASIQQGCLDMLYAAQEVAGKLGFSTGRLYLSGWSQGAWSTLVFLQRLESLGIPVAAAATDATPSDMFALINRWLHVTPEDPTYITIPPYVVPLLGMLINAYADYYELPQLPETAIKPEYQQAARDVYLAKLGVAEALYANPPKLPSTLRQFLKEEFVEASFTSANPFYTLLNRNVGYNWHSKTPMRFYYGTADDVIPPYIATMPVDYQRIMGVTNVTAVKADIGNTKADHRGVFAFGVEDQAKWFEQIELAQTPLQISAFKDVTYFILESPSTKDRFNIEVKYVRNADEAHSDLISHRADLVFMSYDDTISLAVKEKYPDIMAVMPVHGGILDLCGNIDLLKNKNRVGIDTDSGYARALRHYLHQHYPLHDDYNSLLWVKAGATNIRYTELLGNNIDATLLNPPYSYETGVNRMVRLYDAIGDYQGVVVNINKTWLENPANKKRLGDFMSAYYSRILDMKSSALQTIAELEEFYGLSSPEATDVYNRLWQQDGLSLSEQFDAAKLAGTEKLFGNDIHVVVPHQRTWVSGFISSTKAD